MDGAFRARGLFPGSTSNPPPSPWRSIKRLTHGRKNEVDAVPVTAPLESCLLPGRVLTPSLGAHLLTQKFCNHSTFYREQWKLINGVSPRFFKFCHTY